MKRIILHFAMLGFISLAGISKAQTIHVPASLNDTLSGSPLGASTKNLVVLIHGWNPGNATDQFAASTEWTTLVNSLSGNFSGSLKGTDWQLLLYHWETDANTGYIDGWGLVGLPLTTAMKNSFLGAAANAAEKADLHGDYLGSTLYFTTPNLKKVHFVAHSAGSWCARNAAKKLLALNPNIQVEVTLLDPFIPGAANALPTHPLNNATMSDLDESIGASRIWELENYYSQNLPGTDEAFSWRASDLGNTRIDWPFAGGFPVNHYDNNLADFGHAGPIAFYGDSVKSGQPGGSPSSDFSNWQPYSDLVGWQTSLFFREPAFTAQPINRSATVGSTTIFSASASPRGNQLIGRSFSLPTYQWKKNGQIISGATGSTLTLNNLSLADAGDYSVDAIGVGTTTESQTAHLTVYSTLSNGQVTPNPGTTDNTFGFSVTYTSPAGNAPGANGVKVNINGTDYAMTPSGSSWASGVPFSVNRTFAVGGNYNYYFTADLGSGQTARLPVSGTWTLPVTLSVAGWDAQVTGLTPSASQIKPGQSVTVTGSVYNNSTTGNTYNNLGWRVQLFDPSGVVADTRTGTFATLTAPNSANIPAQNFTLNSQGNYQVVFSVLPDRDSNAGNNSRSAVVLVSDQQPTTQYYFPGAYTFTNLNTAGQTISIGGITYIYQSANSTRVTLTINGTSRNVNNNTWRVDGNSIVFVESINTQVSPITATLSFGTNAANYLTFDQVDATGYLGDRVTFPAHCTGPSSANSFNATDPDIYGSAASQATAWYAGFTPSSPVKDCTYRFDIPTSATPGTYNFTIKCRLNNGEFMRDLTIRAVARPPAITNLSTSVFAVGQTISITGTNLGTSGTLYLGDQTAATTSWTSTQIQFVVPATATNGLLRVQTTGGSSGGWAYTVLQVPKLVLVPAVTNFPFGSIQAGSTSVWQTVTISNAGNANLVVNYLSWQNPTTAFYVEAYDSSNNLVSGYSSTIPPQGFITAKCQFRPNALGSLTNNYLLAHNDSSFTPSTLALRATGAGVDTITPVVAFTLPVSTGIYTSTIPTVTIAGTATDNYQLSSVRWSSSGGGSGTNVSSSSVWGFTSLSLVDGLNTFTVTAQDSAGNATATNLIVRYVPPLIFAVTNAPLVVSNGNFLMKLTGPSGSTVILQKSSDLQNWTPIQTNTLPAGGLNYSISVGTNRLQFFRVKNGL